MILVLGGTSDSLKICDRLNQIGISDFVLSVATEFGKDLALEHAKNIINGKMDKKEMVEYIRDKGIRQVIDATHPYAIEVSRNAIEACDMVMKNKNWENVLIATGSKNLATYVKLLKGKKLVARVLPTSEVIRSCESMGLNADNIIALKGPFSKDINVALLKHSKIEVVITKESGFAGGFIDKIEACEELGIPVIIIRRRTIDYQRMIHSIDEIEEGLIFG